MRQLAKCVWTLFLVLWLGVSLGGVAWAAPRGDSLTTSDLARQTAAVDKALAWLRTQQQDDGSFPASFGSPVAITLDALLAGAAAGVDVGVWRTEEGNPSAADYVAAHMSSFATTGGAAGKLLAAVTAAGRDPYTFGGQDLVALLRSKKGGTDLYDDDATGQAWAILGLAAVQDSIPSGAVSALAASQQSDGGWEGGPGWGTDSNTTALALQALAAATMPITSSVVVKGMDYLREQQASTGGFVYSVGLGTAADANSTALALQALVAMGQDPLDADWRKGGASALDNLLALQLAGGAFEWQEGNGANILATVQALPAVLGRPLPFRGAGDALHRALANLATLQQRDGSFGGGVGENLSSSTQALLALVSVGEDPRTWRGAGGASLIDYLSTQTAKVSDAGAMGRLVAALAMAQENPYSFAGRNLVAAIESYYNPVTGAYDIHSNIWNHALALWGLAAVGEDLPTTAVTWLRNRQNADGGWGWATGQASDSNSTALAIQALRAAKVPPSDAVLIKAATFLKAQQTPDGGFAYDLVFGPIPDANSTAVATQGVLALGQDPAAGWQWATTYTNTEQITITVHKPLERLMAFQLPDGAFEWQNGAGANPLATIQAIPALARAVFPQQNAYLAAARRALDWAKEQQQSDGSFPTSVGSPAGITLDAVLAGVALGEDVSTWTSGPGQPSPLDYLADTVDTWATSATTVGKLIVGLVCAGRNPRNLDGVDLVQRLLSYQSSDGVYGASALDQAWAMLALAAARGHISPRAATTLTAMQSTEGGWEGGPGWGVDSNTTALAIQALRAVGVSSGSASIQQAIVFLRAQQAPTGGFGYSSAFGTEADANSTSYAIQGLLAAGEDPLSPNWRVSGRGPLDDLLSFQLANGALTWQAGEGANLLATLQAIPALALKANPLRSQPAYVRIPAVRR